MANKGEADNFKVRYDKEKEMFIHETTLVDEVDYLDHLKGIEELKKMKEQALNNAKTYDLRIEEMKRFEQEAKELEKKHKKEVDQAIKKYSG